MAVSEEVTKKSCSLKLDGGVNTAGKSITYSSSLGTLVVGASPSAIKAVADALSPCLNYTTKVVNYIVTSSLTGTSE